MYGTPWGTMTGWLRLEVEERARRYGPTRLRREPKVVVREPEPRTVPALAKDDVAVCA